MNPAVPSLVLVLISLMLFASAAFAAPTRPARPNILFIAIDDLNDWGVSDLQGRRGVLHPNLDRLATRGTLFLNAHCAAPSCNPSRTAILTGVAPYRSGVYHNNHDWRLNPRLAGVPTLPEYFRAHGYRAIGGGKIFHALEWIDGPSDGFNSAQCWDTFFPSIGRQIPDRLYPQNAPIAKGLGRGERPMPYFDWAPLDEPVEQMPDHKVVDWAIKQLNQPSPQPLFLAVGLFRPHIPWYVPRRFFELYPLDKIELPYVKPGWREKLPPAAQQSGEVRRQWHQWVLENHQWRAAVQGYLASVSYCDWELGRLLDAFDRSAYCDNTIVVLWTDHGFHLGDKATWEKFTLWAESTRVPLIFVAPGVTRPGSQCGQPVSLLDLYPTMLELAGLPANTKNDGLSLAPLLRNPQSRRDRPAVITNLRRNYAVRDKRFHYISYANGDEELYDMATDEGQWDNLATDPRHAKIKARLNSYLPVGDAPGQPDIGTLNTKAGKRD
jgi:arylsulfatase A-like enzyme